MPLLEPVGEVLRVDLAVELLYLAVSGDVDELLVDIVGELLPKSVNRLAVVLDLMEGRGLAVGDDVGGLLLLRNGLVDLNTVGVDLDGALDDDNVARENGDVVVQIRLLCRGGDVDGLIRVGLQCSAAAVPAERSPIARRRLTRSFWIDDCMAVPEKVVNA